MQGSIQMHVSRGTIKPESWGLIIRTETWLQHQDYHLPLRKPTLRSSYQFMFVYRKPITYKYANDKTLKKNPHTFCPKLFSYHLQIKAPEKAVYFENLTILHEFS